MLVELVAIAGGMDTTASIGRARIEGAGEATASGLTRIEGAGEATASALATIEHGTDTTASKLDARSRRDLFVPGGIFSFRAP
jgi:hypothetical protein